MPRKYKVTLFDRSEDEVTADYLLYPLGMLVFKNEKLHSYPEIIKMYAPESWYSVKLVD